MPRFSRDEISLLLRILDQGYNRAAWHGPNLKQSLRGVTAEMAAWRPAVGRHNIWEETLHATYWKYVVRRRLLGAKRGSFPLKGSNWFRRPEELSEKAWKSDLALLDAEHRKLRAAMEQYLLSNVLPKAERMLYGAAFHDVYHAGQIRLLRRLQENR
jgi:hypothetical protein